MDTKAKIPVTDRTIIQRLNRVHAKNNWRIKINRAGRWRCKNGDYSLLDTAKGEVVANFLDLAELEAWSVSVGKLKNYEALVRTEQQSIQLFSAVHEAGHALFAHAAGNKVEKANIRTNRRGNRAGVTAIWITPLDVKGDTVEAAAFASAGFAATKTYFGLSDWSGFGDYGSSPDRQKYAKLVGNDLAIAKATGAWISQHVLFLNRIAEALLRNSQVTGEDLSEICGEIDSPFEFIRAFLAR